jgi:Putative peptidoglycan binding domain
MYDSILNDQFPASPQAVAGYVDGQLGNQPNYAWLVTAFPQAWHLSIALFADHDADALDIEAGAAVPPDIPGWHARQVKRGVARPVIYASAFTMNEDVLPVLSRAGIARASVRLWSAHYDGSAHICGPRSCEALSTGADGTQWTPSAMGRVLDQSLLLDSFFGTSPVSTGSTWTAKIMQDLPVLQQGATGTHVRTVQFQLGERGHGVKVDGVLGPATVAAVKVVQGIGKAAQDGEVGPVTWGLLLGV